MPLLTRLSHTNPHLRIQQVQPHTMLHYIVVIGGVPVARREPQGSTYSPAPNSDGEKNTPHSGTRRRAGSLASSPSSRQLPCPTPPLKQLPEAGKAISGKMETRTKPSRAARPPVSWPGTARCVPGGQSTPRVVMAGGKGSLCRAGSPGHHPTVPAVAAPPALPLTSCAG